MTNSEDYQLALAKMQAQETHLTIRFLIIATALSVAVSFIASCTSTVFTNKVKGAAAVEIAETVTIKK